METVLAAAPLALLGWCAKHCHMLWSTVCDTGYCVCVCVKREWERERYFVTSKPGKRLDRVLFHRPPDETVNPSRITFYPIMCLLLQISLIKMSFLRDGVGLVWQPEIASIHKTCLNYSVTWASVDVNGRWSERLMWPLEKKKKESN